MEEHDNYKVVEKFDFLSCLEELFLNVFDSSTGIREIKNQFV